MIIARRNVREYLKVRIVCNSNISTTRAFGLLERNSNRSSIKRTPVDRIPLSEIVLLFERKIIDNERVDAFLLLRELRLYELFLSSDVMASRTEIYRA